MNKVINCEEIVIKMEDKYQMVFTKLERTLLESAVLLGAIALNKKNGQRLVEQEKQIKDFQIKLDSLTNKKSSIWDLFKRRK